MTTEKQREKFRLSAKKWRENNLEKAKKICREWKLNNPEKTLYIRARKRAENSNLDFSLVVEDIVIPSVCPYLGVPLVLNGGDTSPSIDRIDNTKGYSKDNIEIISFKANRMKNTASVQELIRFSKSVLKKYEDL